MKTKHEHFPQDPADCFKCHAEKVAQQIAKAEGR